jgi:hypothetical protein
MVFYYYYFVIELDFLAILSSQAVLTLFYVVLFVGTSFSLLVLAYNP